MDQKTKRAHILKKLLDAQKSKVPTELNEKDRNKEAASLMDRLVGPDWRIEIQLPDVTIVQAAPTPPPQDESKPSCSSSPAAPVSAVNQAAESFYERVVTAMEAEGIGFEDAFAWDDGTSSDTDDAKKRMNLAKKVLDAKKCKKPCHKK